MLKFHAGKRIALDFPLSLRPRFFSRKISPEIFFDLLLAVAALEQAKTAV
ncbi:hypothetical protein [Caballeronia telluris]|nr:hypothetical protein [Caballeronia telluris]